MMKWEILSDKEPKNSSDVIDILLKNRGIVTEKQIDDFISPRISGITAKKAGIDEDELKKTVQKINDAVKNNEKIIVYGDYDVDGITGTAILWETIYKNYKNVMPFIPHRADEGYGISIKGIDNILKDDPDIGLIITVDNGIVANGAIEYAKKKGIDVVITDHHIKSDVLPDAYSIVHTTKLCGAGVAYILSLALENIKIPEEDDDRLSLAAMATVADLVPLKDCSRAIVKFGLMQLRRTKKPGLLAIFSEARIRQDEIDVYHIGHIIAPRLNAAGRIGHAMDALRLICTKDVLRARRIARELSETNKERQVLTMDGAAIADKVASEIIVDSNFIVVHDASYNEGIIGLVASRIVEKHYRPAIVISVGEKYSKGSARSIAGFNMIEFIREHKHFLVDAGGHPMAAGFTVETTKIEKFKNALVKSSAKIITKEMLDKKINIDMNLDFNLIDLNLYNEIQKLAPFGMGNLEPIFISRKLKIKYLKAVGKEGAHLKFKLYSKIGKEWEAIFFKSSALGINEENSFDMSYALGKDIWNGKSKINLVIKDAIVVK